MGPGRFGSERAARGGKWLRWVVFAVVVGGVGLFAFQLGVEDERGRASRLTEEADRLRQANKQLEANVQQLETDNKTALSQLAALGDRVASESVPGVPRELILALKGPLDAGVDPQRIAGALATLAPPASRPAAESAAAAHPNPAPGEECEPPQTKKFLVRTPISRDQPSIMSAGFGGNAVTVSAAGASVRNAENKAEARFEPKEPVTIRMTPAGGNPVEATGKLPLNHTLTVGPLRYRFAFVAVEGSGYIQVTSDRCKVRP
jgi:hypothetical protein